MNDRKLINNYTYQINLTDKNGLSYVPMVFVYLHKSVADKIEKHRFGLESLVKEMGLWV